MSDAQMTIKLPTIIKVLVGLLILNTILTIINCFLLW